MRDDLEEIRKELEEKERIREEIIKKARELRIRASKGIANIHANKIEVAEKHLSDAEELMHEIVKYKSYPDLFYLAHDALQEFVEAVVFKRIIKEMKIPDKLPIKIPQPVLRGLADVIGELRRYSLTLMVKEWEIERVERIISIMEDIYYMLIEFDFPDKLTGNLRAKLDVARASIERTKSDFVAAKILLKFKTSSDTQ